MNSTIGSLAQIFGNRAVNELKIGYSSAWDLADNTLHDPFTESLLPADVGGRSRIMCMRFLGGYQIGAVPRPRRGFRKTSGRSGISSHYTYQLGPGSHTLKTGGELLSVYTLQGSCGSCCGHHGSLGRPRSGQYSGALPGVERYLDMEEGRAGAGPDRQTVRVDHRRLLVLRIRRPDSGGLGAGRLDDLAAPDPEPRSALRRVHSTSTQTTWRCCRSCRPAARTT